MVLMNHRRRSLLSVWILWLASTGCQGFAATKRKAGIGGIRLYVAQSEPSIGAEADVVQTAESPSSTTSGVQSHEFVLGPDKVVSVLVPPDQISPDASVQERSSTENSVARQTLLDAYAFRGRGDVVWPSSLQLARLIANCPSFVHQKNVLDLGCGLGLASAAALLGDPEKLVLCDVDQQVLTLAKRSCKDELNRRSGGSTIPIESSTLDWSDPVTWPANPNTDVVLASDVLYDEHSAQDIARLLSHLLLSSQDEDVPKRAILVDPINRENRDAFVEAAFEHGLLAQSTPFPGQENGFVLLNVIPRDDDDDDV